MASVFETSARASCRRGGLDPELWWQHVADLAMGTNWVCAGVKSGYNRSHVAEYCRGLAYNTRALLDEGHSPEEVRQMTFIQIWNSDMENV